MLIITRDKQGKRVKEFFKEVKDLAWHTIGKEGWVYKLGRFLVKNLIILY